MSYMSRGLLFAVKIRIISHPFAELLASGFIIRVATFFSLKLKKIKGEDKIKALQAYFTPRKVNIEKHEGKLDRKENVVKVIRWC